MTIHQLKTHPQYFDKVKTGEKTWELRKNDRNFEVGDTLILRRYCPDKKEYTGEALEVYVPYILYGANSCAGLPEDLCVMSVKIIKEIK